ncbi:HipA domain-containing protein [Salegentibacter sp. F188]|uniref:HipA domain-containing protein n=1 Tax=Autumnicola patrickiae TaxID=3075591 RepID=A0ABU3E1T6_9FLAO|nr:HipA domain-containing protein [Salegentibacter sp. F188]MDT0689959.1 HipA domain-containing protein [Salegentibacter sp. F188]
MKNCLACLQPLHRDETNYHPACLADFWQQDTPVLQLDYSLSDLEELAKENIAQRIIVPGVQPKLSLGFTDHQEHKRLTIVGALDGRYILKPPYPQYPQMPEIEFLSMHMAKACGIATVPFLLIPLKDGELAYLTRRIDRDDNGNKYAMEDACQFTEKQTEHKYRGSYEQIAKAILKYNGNRLIDVVRFYEQVIVSYLIGNNDMHLKNFSLIAKKNGSYELAPAYDVLAVQLLMPEDDEELALTLNGKKKKLKKPDFDTAMVNAGIPEKAIENLWRRIDKGSRAWRELLSNSFLNSDNKEKLQELLILKKEQVK